VAESISTDYKKSPSGG